MKIDEEENTELKIKPPGMNCDKPISDLILPPLPTTHSAFGIIGSAGSGKSSWAISLLTNKKAYKKVFENVYFVIPPHSRASVSNKIFEKHDQEKIYDELTPEILEEIKSKVQAESEEGFNSLLVIDDCTVYLKNKSNEMLLKNLIYNRRHLKLTIWLLAQSYTQIPLGVRKCLSHLVLFKPKNKKEYSSIFEELIFLPKEQGDKIIKYIFKKPHDFMYSNIGTNEIFRNFNKLTLTN
jgi:adenosyl cobinamide kinase/adenosyl cobinamide phosphate guanylyltransferase